MDSHFSVSTLSFQLISFAKNGKVGGNLKTFTIPLKIGFGKFNNRNVSFI